MYKKIGLLCFALTALAVVFIPGEAEAARIRIEPSITFRNSYHRVCPQPVYVARPPEVRRYTYYDECGPYCEEVYYYERPYYYPAYPERVHSYGTDYQVQFRLR